jgi:hypothetical protein
LPWQQSKYDKEDSVSKPSFYNYKLPIAHGPAEKFAKKLIGESEVETTLQRLDRLTQDEARMTVAQTLGVVHGLVNNTRVVMEGGEILA